MECPTMNKDEIVSKLKTLRPKYKKEGFTILGIFGSYAKDSANEESDIDILYDLDENIFLKKYEGFKAVSRLALIKDELKSVFHTDIDIADIKALNQVGKKYILAETIYV